MKRRTMLTILAGGAVLLPVKLPALTPPLIPGDPVPKLRQYIRTVRRFRRLEPLMHQAARGNPGWQAQVAALLQSASFQKPSVPYVATTRSKRHLAVALKRIEQTKAICEEFENRQATAEELGYMLWALSDTSPAKVVASSSGIWDTAHAQALDPVIVTAPAPISFDSIGGLIGIGSASNGSQFFQIIRLLAAQQKAQQAALANPMVNTFVVPPAEPPAPVPLVSEPVVVLEHPEAAFFGGPDAQIIQDQLQQRGLELAQALTVLVALRGAVNMIKAASPLITTSLTSGVPVDAFKFIASGLLGGTIAITVTSTGGLVVAGLVGAGLLASGLVAAYFIIKGAPSIDQPVSVFGIVIDDFEIVIEPLPLTSDPEAQIAPESKVGLPPSEGGTAPSENHVWSDFYQAWVGPDFFGAISSGGGT